MLLNLKAMAALRGNAHNLTFFVTFATNAGGFTGGRIDQGQVADVDGAQGGKYDHLLDIGLGICA